MKKEIIDEINDQTAFLEGVIQNIEEDKKKVREIHKDLVTFEVVLKKVKKSLENISDKIRWGE